MLFQVFFLSFLISFLGTIPPATINITVMQLSLKGLAKSGTFLALGAAIMDTIYGGIAVRIQVYLSEKIEFTNSFYIVAALVLIVLGIVSLRSSKKSKDVKPIDDERAGFAKGIVLGLFNPLAMPFWLGWTTYLKVNGLIDLEGINYYSYILGVFLGEIGMLLIIIKVGLKYTRVSDNHSIVNVIPAIVFFVLALMNLIQWASFYFDSNSI